MGIEAPVNVWLWAANVAGGSGRDFGSSLGGSGLPSGRSSVGGRDMGIRVLGSVHVWLWPSSRVGGWLVRRSHMLWGVFMAFGMTSYKYTTAGLRST